MSPRSVNAAREARRLRTLELDGAIDQALTDPRDVRVRAVLRYTRRLDATVAAERVRGRAQRLLRRNRARRAEIITARDALIEWLYVRRAPRGWSVAFCDASIAPDTRRAAIGAILIDAADNRRHLARRMQAADALAAEIGAIEAALDSARRDRITRLWGYTDCVALVRLWQQRHADDRLARLRRLGRGFERIALCAIPRLHNQPANRLARTALRSARAATRVLSNLIAEKS